MEFREILIMALASVGANKLRSALTMLGITIGVFSVISVMTAIGRDAGFDRERVDSALVRTYFSSRNIR